MKLSVSLSDEDVKFIDGYAAEHGVESRSAVLQRAVSLLRSSELGDAYAAAWEEWDLTEASAWDATVADEISSGRGRS